MSIIYNIVKAVATFSSGRDIESSFHSITRSQSERHSRKQIETAPRTAKKVLTLYN